WWMGVHQLWWLPSDSPAQRAAQLSEPGLGRAPSVPLEVADDVLRSNLPEARGVCDTARMTSNPTIGSTEQHREAFEALQTAILDGDSAAVTSAEVRRGAAERR